MRRIMVLSCDCHGSLPSELYGPYIEEKYQERFHHWLKYRPVIPEEPNASENTGDEVREAADLARRVDFSGATDPRARLQQLEQEGVVGEVLFPDMMANNLVPFSDPGIGITNCSRHSDELRWAGMRAHNRWLADFCVPNRQVGLLYVSFHDIEASVKEIYWGASVGFKGAMLNAGVDDAYPLYGSDYFEPMWKALEETGLTVTYHGLTGQKLDLIKLGLGGLYISALEGGFFNRRPLWHLIFGGVLERHPRLKVAWSETGMGWVVRLLAQMDKMCDYTDLGAAVNRGVSRVVSEGVLPLKPSEYWRRQCFIGASQITRSECDLIEQLGPETVMFGTDAPHPDSTWGFTKAYIRSTIGSAGLSEATARKVLGENLARCYSIDTTALNPVVEAVGPRVDELLVAETSEMPPVLVTTRARDAYEDLYLYKRSVRGSIAIG